MLLKSIGIFLLILNCGIKEVEPIADVERPTNRIMFVFVAEQELTNDLAEWSELAIRYLTTVYPNITFDRYIFAIAREDVSSQRELLCQVLNQGFSILIDLTVTGWAAFRDVMLKLRLPYSRISLTNFETINSTIAYIIATYSKDFSIIFQNDKDADLGLYNLIAFTTLRVIILDQFSPKSLERMRTLKPQPSFYIIAASTENMNRLFELALKGNIVTRQDRWLLLFLDYSTQDFKYDWNEYPAIAKFKLDEQLCCKWVSKENDCSCPENFKVQIPFLLEFMKIATKAIIKNENPIFKSVCADTEPDFNNTISIDITRELKLNNLMVISEQRKLIEPFVNISIFVNQENNLNKSFHVAQYTNANLEVYSGFKIKSAKRFLRIGTVESIPWAYYKRNPETNQLILNNQKEPIWEGYCIDLMERLSKAMEFDYEIAPPKLGRFGKRLSTGKWDGIIGDLITGEIDMSVAPLKMTAEREEVIDFIAPYFEQTGISIIMRKPVRQTSLFKFMTVLRLEVWLSIVGALVVTAFMIWILERFSPYSATNNRDAYPYPCRDFTLKESFWFALTSFTPQGGGEAPKAISGRTLVAAYWLFVVLMLATFTANLAAFLTVERMQTPVQSLEQLARQSRINYTVVQNSDTQQYFINMKHAEETLYRVWKEITLNSTSDKAEYRVWDYPIKEQYGHILMQIESSMPVRNASEGFKKVNDYLEADFAFVHDSAEIKYEISRNCNFTEVGEVFAEQPYALAVQQGSLLQDELSRTILTLQKERYFESLTAKYWNQSVKGECENSDDSEGITLESLGGVFIATLFGLALAMITLVGEVFYYRKKEEALKITKIQPSEIIQPAKNIQKLNKFESNPNKQQQQLKIPNEITFGNKFVPASEKTSKVSYISIFPRNAIHYNNNLNNNNNNNNRNVPID